MKGSGSGKRKPSVKPGGRPRGRFPRPGQGSESSGKRTAGGDFPIVGMGASAGGLEAFTSLFEHLPANTGMAFVLVQHLAPGHESALVELLSKHTRMPVREVTEGMAVEPNRVYVIPPNAQMALSDGLLRLVPRAHAAGPMPIDFFLESLAEGRQSKAIGVVLSGTATDGTLGLKAVKAEGGITFAQDEESARYDSMPRSAIASGAVDFVLPPEKIAQELARIGKEPYVNHVRARRDELPANEKTDLGKVFALLRQRRGVDFSLYKPGTVQRRIERRMLLKKTDTLADYVQYLEENEAECDALYDDLLIHVTGFFRDRSAFEALKKKVFPKLTNNRKRDTPVRIWVPGCSTGEEVYSVVMALLDYMGDKAPNIPAHVFGTDISEGAIARAREGLYPHQISNQVPAPLLRRFFSKAEQGYHISKTVRDMVIFARHDLTRDSPYSRLDLVCCRNVLIFLGPVLQKRAFAAFHYGLKPGGYLMLGPAETVGELSDYFSAEDLKHKIYAKRETTHPLAIDFIGGRGRVEQLAKLEIAGPPVDVQREADRALVEHYAPPGVLVNEDMEIVQFRGHTGSYLDPMPGVATLNLLKIARGDLLYELRALAQKAKKTNAEVRKDGISVSFNGETREVNLQVLPVRAPVEGKRHFWVLFDEAGPGRAAGLGTARPKERVTKAEKSEQRRVERELKTTKEYLLGSLQDQEAINEELRTANEEILSSNEELQTTNEELETAKEELQSTNEELTTLNEELQNRNSELAQVAADLRNVLNGILAGIVLVKRDLRVRFFTSLAEKVMNLTPTDIGRPIGDLRPALQVPNLEGLISEVIENMRLTEIEAPGPDGSYYSVRIRPYVTGDKKIDGAVIVLTDITEQRRAQEAKEANEAHFRLLVEGIRDVAIMLLDPDGNVISVNPGVENVLGYKSAEIVGKHLSVVFPGDGHESAEAELAAAKARGRYETDAMRVRKDGSHFWANIVTIALRDSTGKLQGFVKAVWDVTTRKHAEESSRQLSLRLMQAQDQERQRISRELHDSAGPALAALVMNLAGVEKGAGGLGKSARNALAESVNLAKECSQILRTMSYELHPPLLEESGLVSAVRWYVETFAKRSGIKTELEVPPNLKRLSREVEFTVFRVVQESLVNIHRHSGSPTARIKVTQNGDRITAEVRDQGRGMPANVVEGVGIKGMRERVKQLGGDFEIVGDEKGSTTVRATLPTGGDKHAGGKHVEEGLNESAWDLHDTRQSKG